MNDSNPIQTNKKFSELVEKLREIFQIDDAALDFGVYRILAKKSADIQKFLNEKLAKKVCEQLAGNASDEKTELEAELEKAVANANSLGIDPVNVPRIAELRKKINELKNVDADAPTQIYSHLLTFFSRYYDEGDFISKRRYKNDVYAIPYAGEEVKLYWANADQYYTKSSEDFTEYAFKIDGGNKTVRFKLVSAETAKDDTKDADAERRFELYDPAAVEIPDPADTDDDSDDAETEDRGPALPADFIEERGNELFLYFQFKKFPKGTKQDGLNQAAAEKITARLSTAWASVLAPAPTKNDKNRTVLERELTRYTAKNSRDYFIHKDLKKFLTRELDFYIKNEMLHLDDISAAKTFTDIEANLRQIQTMRAIATELIAFMAQLEDFQKKLWLKKKFVVACNYCFTLDRVPAGMLPEIFENEKQQAEWEKLGLDWKAAKEFWLPKKNGNDKKTAHSSGEELPLEIPSDGANAATPVAHALMVDTKFFPQKFKEKLLASFDNLDETCDGVLVHSENFQALRLLRQRYQNQVKCIYIDPPYNTGNDGFIYKDGYSHSSWLTMMAERLCESKKHLSPQGVWFSSIDDCEKDNLSKMSSSIWGEENFIGNIIWYKNNSKGNANLISCVTEYVLCYGKNISQTKLQKVPKENAQRMCEKALSIFNKTNKNVIETNKEFRKWMKTQPLTGGEKKYNKVDENGRLFTDKPLTAPGSKLFYDIIHPVTKKACKTASRGWAYKEGSLKELLDSGHILFGEDEKSCPYLKYFLDENLTQLPTTHLQVTANNAVELQLCGFDREMFSYPKPLQLIKQIMTYGTSRASLILDYFAGSGTTGHAVINLNREDGGRRKYILVEMGAHFETVLKPRIEKVVYSPDWKNGAPAGADKGISHAFKYFTLESYEDTLNNLELNTDAGKNVPELLRDEYLLRYALDIETRGSLLSTADFQKPFDYKLKIAADSASSGTPRKIDLVETFNYLVGLRVETVSRDEEKGYAIITGTLPDGERALVIWRDCEKIDSDALNALLEKNKFNARDNEFGVVFVNGDHAIDNIATDENGNETRRMKVRQIEDAFLDAMFDESEDA